MKMPIITVFTPTYNRAYLLISLYKSLLKQTVKDFVWLIVDDGSTDNTKEIIDNCIREGRIQILYYYQKNHGKYVAHNTGVKLCNTELFVCVDSDDELYPNAVERTVDFWQKNKNLNVCGIVSPKDMGGKAYFKNHPHESTLIGLYLKKQLHGETMLVFRADILKQFLFPEIEGENFMSEEVVYLQIDQKYRLLTQDEYLYKAEYHSDGLTSNIGRIHWMNPISSMITYKCQAAWYPDLINGIKSYGAFLAWKKIRKLSDNMGKIRVNFARKFGGRLVKKYYIKLFEKQRELYSVNK